MKRRGRRGQGPGPGGPPVEEDVRREIEAHIAMRAEELVAAGWDPHAARTEAEKRFGDVARLAGECEEITRSTDRAFGRLVVLEGLRQDLRYAARTLRGSPTFALVAVATLALGIGAVTAVFSVVHGVLLRPLPYAEPDRLVWIEEAHEGRSAGSAVPWPNFVDWREQARSFQGMAAFGSYPTTVLGGDRPARAMVAFVSSDFWRVFVVAPLRGRLTSPDDHTEGSEPTAVVSHRFWSLEMGRDPDVLERALETVGRSHRVMGVLPPGFDFPGDADVWIPAELSPQGSSRTAHNWRVVGRLGPGVSAPAAGADLNAVTARLRERFGPDEVDASGAILRPLHEQVAGSARRPLLLLLGAAGLVLLVACTNLASTLLARGAARARELAVRASLGAGRLRLVRQLLTESMVLAGLGAAAGVALAALVLRGLQAMEPSSVPRLGEVRLDGAVLLFAAAATLLTTVLFGLLPALRLSEGGVGAALRSAGRGNAPDGRGRLWKTLVASEVALALLLLVGSGLLLRSFWQVLGVDKGFQAPGVATVDIALSQVKYPTLEDQAAWYEELLRQAEEIPGVQGVGVLSTPPLSGFLSNGTVDVEDDEPRTATASYQVASAGTFDALGIPLLQGRLFDEGDGADAPHVVVVSRAFAEAVWPGESPLGRRVTGGGMDNYWEETRWATVVGVVGDVRTRALDRAAEGVLYFHYRQRPYRLGFAGTVVARAAGGDAAALVAPLRQVLQRLDPEVPPRFLTMDERIARSVTDRRFGLWLLAGFAGVALLLSAVGIHGVVSYQVARRSREVGIRLALGADPAAVRTMVVRDAMGMVAAGVVLGLAGAAALTRVMRSLLYEVSPADPMTFAAVVVLLGTAALIASYLPARRTTRVDPLAAMRAE